MNYRSIKKIADELNMIVENDLVWFKGYWEVDIELKKGFGFECQFHSTQAIIPDPNKLMKKTKVWDLVASIMDHESDQVMPCDCGYWSDGRSIQWSRR